VPQDYTRKLKGKTTETFTVTETLEEILEGRPDSVPANAEDIWRVEQRVARQDRERREEGDVEGPGRASLRDIDTSRFADALAKLGDNKANFREASLELEQAATEMLGKIPGADKVSLARQTGRNMYFDVVSHIEYERGVEKAVEEAAIQVHVSPNVEFNLQQVAEQLQDEIDDTERTLRKAGRASFSDVWYSKAGDIAKQKKFGGKKSAKEVLKMLDKGGVKSEEIYWSGLSE
ncbi:uncharacterized protein METZ01_LOCUS502155, partial [marine metagenome]